LSPFFSWATGKYGKCKAIIIKHSLKTKTLPCRLSKPKWFQLSYVVVIIAFPSTKIATHCLSLNSSVASRRRLRQQGSSDVVLSPLNPVHDLSVKQTKRTKRKPKKKEGEEEKDTARSVNFLRAWTST
jgi:hypothetical protein